MLGLGLDVIKATLCFRYANTAFDDSVASIQAAMARDANNLSSSFEPTERGERYNTLTDPYPYPYTDTHPSTHSSLMFSPSPSPVGAGVFSRSKVTMQPTTPTSTPRRKVAIATGTELVSGPGIGSAASTGKSSIKIKETVVETEDRKGSKDRGGEEDGEEDGNSDGGGGTNINSIGAIDLANDHSFTGAIDYCMCAMHFIESTSDHQNQTNQMNYLNSLWLKADVLAFLSHLHSNYMSDHCKGEAYALLALDSAFESFDVAEAMKSPLLELLTGQR